VRRAFLMLLLVLLAAGALAWLVRADAGYVLLQYGHTRVETTLWFGLLLLFALLLLMLLVARLWRGLSGLWRRVRGHPAGSAGHMSRDRTAQGLRAYFEGDWERAARLLARGAERSPYPLANHLLAARAAAARGDATLAEGFLALAAELPDAAAAAAVSVERARVQVQLGNPAAAVAALGDGSTSSAARELLLQSLARIGDWERVSALLPDARRERLLPEAALDEFEERAFLARSVKADAVALRQRWDSLPQTLQRKPPLLVRQARALSAAGAGMDALELLVSAITRESSHELVEALGQLAVSDANKALVRAEKLLASHREDAVALLALGRRAAAAKLWGKARDYLEASHARAARPETAELLARVREHTGSSRPA
jgi:HemY protein